MLSQIAKDYITLEMGDDGKITYQLNEGVKKARRKAKRIAKIIDDNRIRVQVEATTLGEESSGGEFHGNKRADNGIIETKQKVDPNKLEEIESLSGDKKGTNILHEVTESYWGGKITLKKNLEYMLPAMKEPIITGPMKQECIDILTSAYSKNYKYYERAHFRATRQTLIKKDDGGKKYVLNKKNEKKYLSTRK